MSNLITLSLNNGRTLTESNIVEDNFSLEHSILSDTNNFRFGGAESSCLKVTVLYEDFLKNIKDTYIEVSAFHQYLGLYKVAEVRRNSNRDYIDITAYDKSFDVYNTNITNWYESYIGENATFKEAYEDLFTNVLKIKYTPTPLPMDDILIAFGKTSDTEIIYARKVLRDLSEINRRFLLYDSVTNKYEFKHLGLGYKSVYPDITLYPSTTLYPVSAYDKIINTNNYFTLSYDDTKYEEPGNLVLKAPINNTMYPLPSQVGADYANYIIEDNLWFRNDNYYGLRNIASAWSLDWVPVNFDRITQLKKPHTDNINAGDYIGITDLDGNTLNTIVLNKLTKGVYNAVDIIS